MDVNRRNVERYLLNKCKFSYLCKNSENRISGGPPALLETLISIGLQCVLVFEPCLMDVNRPNVERYLLNKCKFSYLPKNSENRISGGPPILLETSILIGLQCVLVFEPCLMDVNRPNVMRIQPTYTQTRGSKWPKLYIPSTLNTQPIQANKSGLALGRQDCTSSRVSIQGVKSVWGDRVVFPRLGTGDTDRGHSLRNLGCALSSKEHTSYLSFLDRGVSVALYYETDIAPF